MENHHLSKDDLGHFDRTVKVAMTTGQVTTFENNIDERWKERRRTRDSLIFANVMVNRALRRISKK